NVPAVENVLLNVAPGASVPDLNDPSSAVASWAGTSLLVPVTVPPTATENRFWGYALVVNRHQPVSDGNCVPVVPVDGEDGELDPHPTVNAINPASTLNRNLMYVSISGEAIAKALPHQGRVFPHDLKGKCNFAVFSFFPKFEVLSVGVTRET